MRSENYITDAGGKRPGLSLEKLFFRLDVDVVFAGHEHIFQAHDAQQVHKETGAVKRCLHVGCGATIESYFYKGPADSIEMEWYERKSVGFVAAEIVTTSTESTLRVMFVRVDGTVAKTIVKKKDLQGHPL